MQFDAVLFERKILTIQSRSRFIFEFRGFPIKNCQQEEKIFNKGFSMKSNDLIKFIRNALK